MITWTLKEVREVYALILELMDPLMCQLDDSRHKGGGRSVDDILNVVDGGLVVQVKTELVLNFLHTFVGLEKE